MSRFACVADEVLIRIGERAVGHERAIVRHVGNAVPVDSCIVIYDLIIFGIIIFLVVKFIIWTVVSSG